MELVTGGVYQGKLDYAREKYGLDDSDIFICTDEPVLDTSRRCIYGLERYILACVRAGVQPEPDFPEDAVIICRDIFCGVVPCERKERLWREETGKAFTALAARADTVTRIFCGIAQKIK